MEDKAVYFFNLEGKILFTEEYLNIFL